MGEPPWYCVGVDGPPQPVGLVARGSFIITVGGASSSTKERDESVVFQHLDMHRKRPTDLAGKRAKTSARISSGNSGSGGGAGSC